MRASPMWAQDLLLQVALDEGREDPPELAWRRSRAKRYSTGHTQFRRSPGAPGGRAERLVVTAGTDPDGQRVTLLHELAHWLCPAGEHHGPLFYDTAWRLCRRYGANLRCAFEQEAAYRAASVPAYFRSRRPRRPLAAALPLEVGGRPGGEPVGEDR
jgi:hypothetical protein